MSEPSRRPVEGPSYGPVSASPCPFLAPPPPKSCFSPTVEGRKKKRPERRRRRSVRIAISKVNINGTEVDTPDAGLNWRNRVGACVAARTATLLRTVSDVPNVTRKGFTYCCFRQLKGWPGEDPWLGLCPCPPMPGRPTDRQNLAWSAVGRIHRTGTVRWRWTGRRRVRNLIVEVSDRRFRTQRTLTTPGQFLDCGWGNDGASEGGRWEGRDLERLDDRRKTGYEWLFTPRYVEVPLHKCIRFNDTI